MRSALDAHIPRLKRNDAVVKVTVESLRASLFEASNKTTVQGLDPDAKTSCNANTKATKLNEVYLHSFAAMHVIEASNSAVGKNHKFAR